MQTADFSMSGTELCGFIWAGQFGLAEILTVGVFFTKILNIDKITKEKMNAIKESKSKSDMNEEITKNSTP